LNACPGNLSARQHFYSDGKEGDTLKHKLLASDARERTFILLLDEGDEAFSSISAFAEQNAINAASVTAIGAFSRTMIAFFEFGTKSYKKIPVPEQAEVLSMIGDIAVDEEGKPSLHLHAVLGLPDGSTKGGHFMEGYARPTLEVLVRETPAYLRRRKNPDLGVALIELG
jgi:predicted DNA-binding protein with PD1-like motif